MARDRGVEIGVKAPADRLLVLGDRDELMRVFENLVENALKYAASGKKVDIVLSIEDGTKTGREALVGVRDYGPGIAPEHLPRLTERLVFPSPSVVSTGVFLIAPASSCSRTSTFSMSDRSRAAPRSISL